MNPAQDRISVARKEVEKVYGNMARALVAGDAEDKALALQIVGFVKQMPPFATKHQALVESIRSVSASGARDAENLKPKAPERGREKPGDEKTQ